MSKERNRLERAVAELASACPSGRVCVLLSGGVDSAVLASAAFRALGGAARALTLRSEFLSAHDADWARSVAAHLGISHHEGEVRLLQDPAIRAHENDRCYRCKSRICAEARRLMPGALLLDGTNADDDPHRPGRRALRENGVRSALEECGLGNQAVSELAVEYGLPNAGRASDSCLATRLPAGRPIRAEDLARVARIEELLREEGLEDVRARVRDNKVIVEIPEGCEKILERAHRRIMETITGLGLSLAGYAPRATEGERAQG